MLAECLMILKGIDIVHERSREVAQNGERCWLLLALLIRMPYILDGQIRGFERDGHYAVDTRKDHQAGWRERVRLHG